MIVKNHQLFSHTYLARLQADSSHDEAAAPIAQGLRDWMPFRDTSSLQSLIDSWVGPVLDFLEFHHAPAEDEAHIRLLYARRGDETPVGLCYIVPPGQDLNDTIKGRHPMAQAVLALCARNLRWGMLTDGACWRLVDAQALRRYKHYVEVDLDELARSDDPTPLRLFYAFFHRSAFTPDTHGGNGLDRIVTASVQATKAAEDHLKAQVSHNEGIMAQLCLGLVRADGRARYTEAKRDAIYRDATYLLYRILFILYAEARGLLPVDNPAYRAVSLAELVKTAHDYKLHGRPDPQATTLWERLKRLCNAIYESDPVLGIPAYNGGLFDDADKPYLHDGYIADAYLTEALFDLAYMPDKVPGTSEVPGTSYRPVDYRDLSVRHLGSLYEGMIEYKLQIAEETLWARRDSKGNLRFLRKGQEGAPRKTDKEIKQDSVYFAQSPGERRATGTYYTPEYIVDYIVSQTVWRGLEERRAPLEEKLAGWLEEIAAVQTSEVSKTSEVSEVSRMQRTADEELLRFVEEQVLTFRVCDPAMGSGHFLVNAAHQITNFIVETLHLTPWANEAADTDPVAWRRRVVERCLYGVDLSLMAVELAKLSLWLASVAEGKPLSFLDHHLRQGNSLIGARLEDLAEVLAGVASTRPSRQERKAREAGQLSMLDDPAFSRHVTAATDLLAQISARVVERVEDVKAQAADYEQVRSELEPYRRLADLLTAQYFGMQVEERLPAIVKYAVNGALAQIPEYEVVLDEARQIASDNHFFHWYLEFPFLAIASGFNCVLGNPPYGAALSSNEIWGISSWRKHGKSNDTVELFLERAASLVEDEHLVGMIVPKSIAFYSKWKGIRAHLLHDRTLVSMLDVGLAFENVTYEQLILVFHRTSPHGALVQLAMAQPLRIPERHKEIVPLGHCKQSLMQQEQVILFTSIDEPTERIISKIVSRSCRIGDIAKDIFRGIYIPATEREKLPPGDVPFVKRNADVGRYSLRRVYHVRLPREDWRKQAERVMIPRIFLKALRGSRLIAAYDSGELLTTVELVNITLKDSTDYDPLMVVAVINSPLPSFYIQRMLFSNTTETARILDAPYSAPIPIPLVEFVTSPSVRKSEVHRISAQFNELLQSERSPDVFTFVDKAFQHWATDVAHDLLAYLAQQMIDFNKEHQRLEREADLFRFVERDTPCLPLDKALGRPLSAGEMVGDLSAVRHDIEGLRLSREEDGRWLLEMRAKLRNPESGWRKHQRDKDGKFIRQWLPVYRLPLDEAMGRFYHYAFANLDGFDGAGKFPGGFTRTTLKKLQLTKVPRFVPVDLAPMAALDAELAEVRRKIQLTDDLIDQIVYKLYGLTEEEIAIVEGRA